MKWLPLINTEAWKGHVVRNIFCPKTSVIFFIRNIFVRYIFFSYTFFFVFRPCLFLASFNAIFSFPKYFLIYFVFFFKLCLFLVTYDAIFSFPKYFLPEIIFARNIFCPKYYFLPKVLITCIVIMFGFTSSSRFASMDDKECRRVYLRGTV